MCLPGFFFGLIFGSIHLRISVVGRQEEVAKIVHCGENYSLVVEQEATREMASSFSAIVPSN